MCIMLLKEYYSSFAAVEACYLTKLLPNKDESLEWAEPAFKCDQWKSKESKESIVSNYTVESIGHSIWKDYRNCKVSLLMPE